MKPRRRRDLPPQVRVFRCPNCGRLVPATKRRGKTALGHIKTMSCYFCGELGDFVQVG